MDSDEHNIYFTTATNPAPLYKLNTTTWTYTSVDLSVSGEGAALRYYDGKIYVGTKTGNFEVFNKDTLQSLTTYTPGGPTNMPDLHVDSEYLYYHTYSNTLYKVNLSTGSTTSKNLGGTLSSLSGNTQHLVISDTTGQYHIINKTTLDTVFTKTDIGATWSTAADPLGRYFYITDRDGYVRVWDDTTDQEVQTYELDWNDITNGMKVSAKSQKLILRDNSAQATVLNLDGYSGNSAPTASFSTDETLYVNEEASFNASTSSDSDGSITNYSWDWTNDGSYDDYGVMQTYTYTETGYVNITLRVTDNEGATDIQTQQKYIYPEPTPPVPEASTLALTGIGSLMILGLAYFKRRDSI